MIRGVEYREEPTSGPGSTENPHLSHNTLRVRKLDTAIEFFALCTPEGEWYERGRMVWFVMVAEKKSEELCHWYS